MPINLLLIICEENIHGLSLKSERKKFVEL